MRKWAITGAVGGVAVGTGSAMAANVPIQLASGSFDKNIEKGMQKNYRFRIAALLAVATLAGLSSRSMAAVVQTPISLNPSSFNENSIAGSGSAANASTTGAGVTVTIDAGTSFGSSGQATYYLLGYNNTVNNSGHPGQANPSTGVPLGTTITSLDQHFNGSSYSAAGLPSTEYAFQSATATYNTAYVDSNITTQTLTFSSPAAYSTLSFLGESGSSNLQVEINYVNPALNPSAPISVFLPGWFNSGNVAYEPDGRVFTSASSDGTPFTNFDNGQTGNPNGDQLYEADITLPDQTDAIQSVTLESNGGGRAYIYALSGQAVPEPASVGILGIAAGMLMKRRRRSNSSGRLCRP
jgi:hypothetical protein